MSLSPPQSKDAKLVEEARGGSRAALAQLVARHQTAVRTNIARLVPELDAADDLAQETFLAAIASLDSLTAASDFRPWILAIARNKVCTYLRARVRERRQAEPTLIAALEEVSLAECELASEAGTASDWLPRLRLCLSRLAPHSRRIVNSYYFRGESAGTVAAKLGRRSGAVRMALTRIRQALGRCLERSARQEEGPS